MRAGKSLPALQFGQHRVHIGQRALHPFELRIGKAFAFQGIAHSVVGDDRSVIAFRAFIEFDGIICNRGGLQLLRHPPLHIAHRLPDFQQTLMRIVGDGVGVDARADFGLGGEDFLDCGFIQRPPPSDGPSSR
jgi:hypothetical protein